MRAIIRQARANLRGNTWQTALVLLTLFAAAILLTVALNTRLITGGAYDRLLERSNGAHLWLNLDPDHVTAEEIKSILAELPGIEASTGVIQTYNLLTEQWRNDEQPDVQRLREWSDEFQVNIPQIVDGEGPHPRELNAILLDRNVAHNAGVEVGETVELPGPDGPIPLEVIGLFVTAEWCPYYYCEPAPSYLAAGALEGLGLLPTTIPGAARLDVGLRLKDPEDTDAVLAQIEAALPDGSIITRHTWQHARELSEFSLLLQRVFLTTFGIVACLAAGFLIANTIGESVRSQTRQIGLLKAVGFTSRQLAAIYLAESLTLAAGASLAGLAAGSLFSPLILGGAMAQFGETAVSPPLWVALAIPVVTLCVAALFTLGAVRRAVRLDVVTAIRVGPEPPRRRAYRLPRRLLPLAMGVGDAISRPRRSGLLALGLAIAAFTLTVALIANVTVRAIATEPKLGILQDGDILLGRSAYVSDQAVRQALEAHPDVSAYYSEAVIRFSIPEGQEQNDLSPYGMHLRDGNLDAFEFPLLSGHLPCHPHEATIGYGLVREQGLGIGDAFTVLVEDQSLTFEVVGTYRELSRLGLMMIALPEAVAPVDANPAPFGYVLRTHPGANVDAVAADLEEWGNGQIDAVNLKNEGLPEMVTALEGIMAALSLTLGGLGTLGVLSIVWMSVRERRREFGLLKAVGMTPEQIGLSVLSGAGAIALAGYLVGTPTGIIILQLLMNATGRLVGLGPSYLVIDWPALVALLPGVVLIALIGSLLPARRAGLVSVVETMRYE